MTDRFSSCLPYTLAQECPFPNDWSNPKNFSNDSHDPGGATMCGITQRELDQENKHDGLVCYDVRQLSEDQGKRIYAQNYWLPHCPNLPPGLDLQFFDSSVNEGCLEAVRILQHAIEIEPDGLWGPHTSESIVTLKSVMPIRICIEAFTARRKAVYQASKGFQYFGKDWLRRSDEIGAQALKMAAA